MGNYALVIDDDDDMHTLISDVLRTYDVQVHSALSGHDGLYCMRQHVPDLIILDLCMPHLTGWELIKRIRDNPSTAGVPIIVLTSFPVDRRLAASLDLPPEHIVLKSQVLTELPQVVGKMMR